MQAKAALKLYERLISPGGPTTYQQIAEDLGVVASTVHRQCTSDTPVQLRTVAALMQRDREGGQQMLDILGDACGISWAVETPEQIGERRVVATACRTVQSLARLTDSIAKALEDGSITPNEVDDLVGTGSRGEHAIKTFLAEVQAVQARNVQPLPKRA